MRRRFQQVDVFSPEPYRGNPVAVILDGDELSEETMQLVARWTNLSETVFVQAPTTPGADYRARIFTLARELPFAGHPTLGTCHAWLASGGRPGQAGVVVQECGAGLVPVRQGSDGLAFAAPPLLRSGPVEVALVERIATILGLGGEEIVDSQWVDNGPGWVAVLLPDADRVLAVEADAGRAPGEPLDIGVVGPYPPGSECAFEVRGLFDAGTGVLMEDPVTGSLNASLAQWLLGSGRATAPYVTSQGTVLGRRGRPRITQDADGTIWVGGATTTLVEGEIEV